MRPPLTVTRHRDPSTTSTHKYCQQLRTPKNCNFAAWQSFGNSFQAVPPFMGGLFDNACDAIF
jgi:hypothetical protein